MVFCCGNRNAKTDRKASLGKESDKVAEELGRTFTKGSLNSPVTLKTHLLDSFLYLTLIPDSGFLWPDVPKLDTNHPRALELESGDSYPNDGMDAHQTLFGNEPFPELSFYG